MKTVNGIYASAKIFTDTIEDYALAQIKMLCDNEAFCDSKIRIMPDVHPGKVGTVGLTMTVGKKLIPYLLGGDIGCGVSCVVFKTKRIEGKRLDAVIWERGIPHPVSFLEGEQLQAYLHDVEVVQRFAALNRACILDEICKGMKWKATDRFDTVHNYVSRLSDGTPLLRKGAVSAQQGERLLIPINMKEGMLLCEGKGNPDWNFSAPHGSGRVLRRDQVKEHFTVSDYKREMKGIYSTCISRETLDEAPFAYRGMEEIAKQLEETAWIRKILRPVYNFKAGGNR